jgi:hypothetical protein
MGMCWEAGYQSPRGHSWTAVQSSVTWCCRSIYEEVIYLPSNCLGASGEEKEAWGRLNAPLPWNPPSAQTAPTLVEAGLVELIQASLWDSPSLLNRGEFRTAGVGV